jgi:hypothetical protein
MNYQLDIINKEDIPSNVYFHGKNENYQYIHKFKFSNGLTFVIGTESSGTSVAILFSISFSFFCDMFSIPISTIIF